MAMIGCLGDIVFYVSRFGIKTIKDVKWSGQANVQTHSRHLMKALPEFTGVDADTITFSITVSRYLGSDPADDIAKITAYESMGSVVPLIIGTSSYGTYKWIVKKHTVTFEQYDKYGNLIGAKISVTLIEYPKE